MTAHAFRKIQRWLAVQVAVTLLLTTTLPPIALFDATPVAAAPSAQASVSGYFGADAASSGFSAATGSAPIAISFDTIPAGTDITDQPITVPGANPVTVTFRKWTYASVIAGVSQTSPLIVVDGNSTFTPIAGFSYFGGNTSIDTSPWRLLPTSGSNILSP